MGTKCFLIIFVFLSWSVLSIAAPPYTPVSIELNKGAWLKQLIYYPKEIGSLSARPLIVISHGNGHNYKFYTYLQSYLASYGFIVMSHSNNTGPGIETASTTTLENTDTFLEHLSEIDRGVLVNKVQTKNIAWIGHSRGGEGVVRAYTRIFNGSYKAKFFDVNSIKLVSSIAPTTFLSRTAVDPHEVTYHMFVGGADGDVTGSPYAIHMSMPIYEIAQGEKQLTYIEGAGHNVFNDQNADEGRGPDRLPREMVHTVAKATYLALFETYLDGGAGEWKKYLVNNSSYLRLPDIPKTVKLSNEYKMAMRSTDRLVIDDFQNNIGPETASSGAKVTYDVMDIFKGTLQDNDRNFQYRPSDPMNGMTRYLGMGEAPRGLAFDWDKEANITYELPLALQNLSSFKALSLRAAQISRHPLTVTLNSDVVFTVILADSLGAAAQVRTSDFGAIATPYRRDGGWADEFNVLRIPLSSFKMANPALQMDKISKLIFVFGKDHGSDFGRIAIDDVEALR